jgi:acetylornithine deacetylase
VSVADILADLVAVPSLPGRPNDVITGLIRERLARDGVTAVELPGPEGDRSNLFATIGPADRPGIVLSAHTDVVPTEGQNWTSDPFRLTTDGDRLTGRGTSDMKGFVACVLALVPEFAALPLARPIHIALSYDEEIGCRGVPHLLARLPGLCAPPEAAIIGEPTDMRPVLSHKGKRAVVAVIEGEAGHSSNPSAGANALYPAGELLLRLRDRAAALAASGPFDRRFDPPHSTLQAGVIRGGSALNIIPDRAEIEIEARTVPAQSPDEIIDGVLADLARLGGSDGSRIRVSHRELSAYPALPPPDDPTLGELLARLTGHAPIDSVSFGTEAGLYRAAGIPSIICGPGSITRAHRADEYVLGAELAACCDMLRQLGRHLTAA